MTFDEATKINPGSQTIAGVMKDWAPGKVADHFTLNGCSAQYLAQSVALASMSLLSVGADPQQVMVHTQAIADACATRLADAGRTWGHA